MGFMINPILESGDDLVKDIYIIYISPSNGQSIDLCKMTTLWKNHGRSKFLYSYIYGCQMSFCVTRESRSCNMRLNFTHKNRILCNGHENYVKVLFQFIFIYYNILVWKIRLNQSWFVCIHKRNDKKHFYFFFFSWRCEG